VGRTVTETAGPLLFARYAYPPNALGLCGADSPRTLLEYGDAAESDGGLAELARTFDGAWPYLALIAESNRIESPLDPRVVEAYWVGNELLDGVDATRLARHVHDRFRGRLGRAEEQVVGAVAHGALPHHSFHVFAVYPWLGLLRTGVVEQPLHILDRCRVTPAVVESVADGTADVLAQPLEWDGRRLRLGESSSRTVQWNAGGGLAFVHGLSPGDRVALHWDFVCDRLTPAGERALRRATERALRAVNSTAAPAATLG
jgi:hypothetical protein